MKNIDSLLQQHVILACENLPECAFSGPCAFFVIAEYIVSMMQSLAHNVNSGLLATSLCNFQGKDVIKCMFVICNILHAFLNCGIPAFDCTTPMLMDHPFNVFMTVSNTQFCNCVQNLKDFLHPCVNVPEALFAQVQDCCNTIITMPGAVWFKTKKPKAVFTAGEPTQCQPVGTDPPQALQPAPAPDPSNWDTQSGGGYWSQGQQP